MAGEYKGEGLEGFYTPITFGAEPSPFIEAPGTLWEIDYDSPASPAYETATSSGDSGFTGANPFGSVSARDVFGGIKDITNFALQTNAYIQNANNQRKDQALNTYLKTAQIDAIKKDSELNATLKSAQAHIAETLAEGEIKTAAIKANTGQYLAQAQANAAKSAGTLAQLGGNKESIMMYLTIAGVLLAFIQVVKSAKK